MARRVYANGKQYTNKEELQTAIFKTWDEIESNLLNTLVDSMPRRLFEVIEKKGASISY